ncbi:MAG: DNA primase [Sphingomonas sp.]|nr:DNA primase [Sphingomonas sp.]MBN8807247.1 DNA primase [Sphingomonas sp.]
MSLSPAFLDELRARTLLSALVGKSVKLTKAGREFKGCCPFHNEKTPSFYVNDDKGFYHCFGCSAHGDAIRWMTEQRGLPFIDAVKELAQSAGMEMPAQDRQAVVRAERAKGLHEAMQAAADWFEVQLGGLDGAEARDLLTRRQISDATRRAFNFGFAPDARGKLRTALKDFGDELLIEAGLLIKVEGKEPYDRFRGRLMIPIRDPRGRVIAFGGRIIGAGEPKYLNSPDTPLFDKGRTLYNLDKAGPASRKTDRLIVVEGYMDAIALTQAGFADVVAPNGTAVTEAQLERMWRLADVPILCFDGDAAGQKAAIRAAIRALPDLHPGRSLSFASLPEGQDPDDLLRARGADAFERVLQNTKPLVDVVWQHELGTTPLHTPEERASLGKRLRDHARQIKDEDLKSEYLATFNRRVWDYFHPERPSESFHSFKSRPSTRPIAPRVRAIAQFGIDQVTMIPSVIKGLILHPDLIAPKAETVQRLPINATKLRLTRIAMLDAVLSRPTLETDELRAILKGEGLADVLNQMDALTLAFSFLNPQSDKAVAERELTLAIDALVDGPAFEADIADAQSRLNEWSDQDFDDYVGLVKTKQDMERLFRDALLPEDETPVV